MYQTFDRDWEKVWIKFEIKQLFYEQHMPVQCKKTFDTFRVQLSLKLDLEKKKGWLKKNMQSHLSKYGISLFLGAKNLPNYGINKTSVLSL